MPSETFTAKNGVVVKKGDIITLDGSNGEVMLGAVPTVPVQLTGDFGTLMTWVDAFRTMKVRTNADTPHDSKVAREFGAEGIGLCRTEHMFFDAERIAAVREMILSEELEGRERALAKIMPMQKGDFIGIFREMKGLPVTIRLLDPPLHEFLPQEEKDIEDLARTMKVTVNSVKHKIEFLHEFNPMLGHRGCRLGITYPEIYDMQVRAIMEAACELVKNEGFSIVPEIMIPLIATVSELQVLKQNAVAICEEVIAQYGVKVEYLIGTMIELPRAALTADEIAAGSGVLLLRHQRPDPDHLRSLPRRCRQVPAVLRGSRHPAGRPLRVARPGRRRQTGQDGLRTGARNPPGDQARHLRRAWRRSCIGHLLPQHRSGLCLLFTLPGADRPPGGSPCRAGLIRAHSTNKKDGPSRSILFLSLWHEMQTRTPSPSYIQEGFREEG